MSSDSTECPKGEKAEEGTVTYACHQEYEKCKTIDDSEGQRTCFAAMASHDYNGQQVDCFTCEPPKELLNQ